MGSIGVVVAAVSVLMGTIVGRMLTSLKLRGTI